MCYAFAVHTFAVSKHPEDVQLGIWRKSAAQFLGTRNDARDERAVAQLILERMLIRPVGLLLFAVVRRRTD